MTYSPLRAGRQEIFDQLGWLSVKQLILYHSMLTVYRIRSFQEPKYLASRLSRENRNGHIILPKSNLSLHRNRAAKDLSLLPPGLRQSRTITCFKKELKTLIKREISRFLD